VWHLPKQKCIPRANLESFLGKPNDKHDIYVQDVTKGSNILCPIQKKEKANSRNVTTDNGEVKVLSTKDLKVEDIKQSISAVRNISHAENKLKSNDSYQTNGGGITSKQENQELNVSCVSCECPCESSYDLSDQTDFKGELDKQIVSASPPKSNDDTNLSLTSKSDIQDKKDIKPKNPDEDFRPDAENESDNLIQSGIVIDISSIKEQGLEQADKACKYISYRNIMHSFSH